MIFGICPTRDAVVVARTVGSGETFVVTSITAIRFQTACGDDLAALRSRLMAIFGHGDKRRRPTIALLGSSSGRFKSSVEAIKAEAVAELAAVESGVAMVKVTTASLKKALGCATGQKWHARAAERFNADGLHANWSRGAAGATAAALKVAGDASWAPPSGG
jgi:hypothetical protein